MQRYKTNGTLKSPASGNAFCSHDFDNLLLFFLQAFPKLGTQRCCTAQIKAALTQSDSILSPCYQELTLHCKGRSAFLCLPFPNGPETHIMVRRHGKVTFV